MKIPLVLALTFILAAAVYWLTPPPERPPRWDGTNGEPVPDDFIYLCVERNAPDGRAILATHAEWTSGVVKIRTSPTASREVEVAALRLAMPGKDDAALRECERIWNSQINPQARLALSLTKKDAETDVATVVRHGMHDEYTYFHSSNPTPLAWHSQTQQTLSANQATRLAAPAFILTGGIVGAVFSIFWRRKPRTVTP